MKTAFLISSIFYIIGLFFGSKIHVVKNSNAIEKIIPVTGQNNTPEKAYYFNPSLLKQNEKTDSLKLFRNKQTEIINQEKTM